MVDYDPKYFDSRWARRERAQKLDWETQEGPIGDTVFLLRRRGRRFDNSAIFVLILLLAVIGSGIGYYLARPLLENENRIERRVHEERREAELAEKDALEKQFLDLRRDIANQISAFWFVIQSGTGWALRDLALTPDGAGAAVGWNGTIVTRTAPDVPWVVAESGTKQPLNAIALTPDGAGVAVGDNGTIVTRTAPDVPWVVAESGTEEDLREIALTPDGAGVAVGPNGMIVTRAAPDAPWVVAESGTEEGLYAIALTPDGAGVAVGDNGTIVRRAAPDAPWEVAESGTEETLYAIALTPDGAGVAVGLNGTIVTRAAPDAPWVVAESGTEELLTDIALTWDGAGVAVGLNGTIVTRAAPDAPRGGAESGAEEMLGEIAPTPDGAGAAVGDNGTIVPRASPDAPWSVVESGTKEHLVRIALTPDGAGAAVGGNGTFVTRAAPDAPWVVVESGTGEHLGDIALMPDGAGVAVGQNGTIVATPHDLVAQASAPADPEALRQFLDDLRKQHPNYRENPVHTQRLAALNNAYTNVAADLKDATDKIAEADTGVLSRREQLREFREFLAECRAAPVLAEENEDDDKGPEERPEGEDTTPMAASGSEEVKACAEAYTSAIVDVRSKKWWELLAETAPQALLLVFLLATLGGLYRYNLKMAGFYYARADALAINREPVMPRRFEELATTLAADKVDFRNAKTPMDTVVDLSKEAMRKMPGG
ncbi:MAG: WD40 repeat domain-containing protein [Pseudomonadota bacterium]